MPQSGFMIYTMGDPHSINVEAFLRVVAPMSAYTPVLVIGSKWQFDYQTKLLNIQSPPVHELSSADEVGERGLFFLDPNPYIGCRPPEDLPEAERGALMLSALQAVPRNSTRPMAVLTAPIDKHAASLAGFKFPGQTEFFEDLWQSPAVMFLAGPKLRVALATNHLALKDVASHLTQAGLEQKINVLGQGLQKLFGFTKPRIAVCGLNPHCGDQGLFGSEDTRIVRPAVLAAQSQNKTCVVQGPLPADTIFYRAAQGDFDAVLAMYHDQGLGPLKTLHFDNAVNISLGLRHLRVSPDHGPARDLYGTGRASWKSFEAALQLCQHYLKLLPSQE